jgi:protein-tyrosine-phosphatase
VAKKLKDVPPLKLLTWNIDDPYGDDLEEYRRCALKINQEVSRLPIQNSSA